MINCSHFVCFCVKLQCGQLKVVRAKGLGISLHFFVTTSFSLELHSCACAYSVHTPFAHSISQPEQQCMMPSVLIEPLTTTSRCCRCCASWTCVIMVFVICLTSLAAYSPHLWSAPLWVASPGCTHCLEWPPECSPTLCHVGPRDIQLALCWSKKHRCMRGSHARTASRVALVPAEPAPPLRWH
jgi:hypothetical protein